MNAPADPYPLRFDVDYPDRPLDRLTTFFRLFTVIPIFIVLASVDSYSLGYLGYLEYLFGWFPNNLVNWVSDWNLQLTSTSSGGSKTQKANGGGIPSSAFSSFRLLLMLLFRRKYPRWWFDWNLELLRFSSRVSDLLQSLLRDEYPSTDEEQAVHLRHRLSQMPSKISTAGCL